MLLRAYNDFPSRYHPRMPHAAFSNILKCILFYGRSLRQASRVVKPLVDCPTRRSRASRTMGVGGLEQKLASRGGDIRVLEGVTYELGRRGWREHATCVGQENAASGRPTTFVRWTVIPGSYLFGPRGTAWAIRSSSAQGSWTAISLAASCSRGKNCSSSSIEYLNVKVATAIEAAGRPRELIIGTPIARTPASGSSSFTA